MADKTTQLILHALTRAAAEPAGLALHAQKTEPGLFPSTAVARTAADRARAEGLIDVVAEGRREVGVLTERGMRFLIDQASPRQVLEDFVRAIEERQQAVVEMGESVARMADGLQAVRTALEQILPRLEGRHTNNGTPMNGTLTHARPAAVSTDELIADIKAHLSEWHAAAGASQDCPLPDLYRKLDLAGKASVGLFHDALRQLHDDHQIYLHPWTGPLYTLPQPAFALMVGHEVAYYASIR